MNIGIVGLGLIGGTYAKSLRKYPYNLVGIDIDEETLKYALDHDVVDIATSDPLDVLGELDVIFVCLYPNDTIKFINKYANKFKRGSVISDVSGIKRKLADNLSYYKNEDFEIVLAHPIAGRESKGIKYSSEAIFHNSNFVITPTKHNSPEAIDLIKTLAIQMGFKNVSQISDVEHDEIIAFTSQLTHVIALSLINSDSEKYDTSLFIGDSYKDLTRVAKINKELWTELFFNNKDFLIKQIDNFENEITVIKEAIQSKDSDKMYDLMQKAADRRRLIE